MSKLEEFLDDHGIFYRPRENSVTVICPNCNKEKLDIHKSELNYICYYCADTTNPVRGPNATKLLADLSGVNYGIVKRKLSGFISMLDFANYSITQTVEPVKVVEEISVKFPELSYRLNAAASKPAVEYLQNIRGIPLDIGIKYDLRYEPKKLSIIFPVYDNKKLIGYQNRSIDPNCPKQYQKMTLKGFEKSDYLMFEDSIVGNSVILAEGPISALKFARTGVGFVATMGKYVSEKQMLRLRDRGIKRIYLALDDDAFAETKKLSEKYESMFEFYLLQLNDAIKKELKDVKKPDFGDCNFQQIAIVLKEAIPFNRSTAFLIESERIFK